VGQSTSGKCHLLICELNSKNKFVHYFYLSSFRNSKAARFWPVWSVLKQSYDYGFLKQYTITEQIRLVFFCLQHWWSKFGYHTDWSPSYLRGRSCATGGTFPAPSGYYIDATDALWVKIWPACHSKSICSWYVRSWACWEISIRVLRLSVLPLQPFQKWGNVSGNTLKSAPTNQFKPSQNPFGKLSRSMDTLPACSVRPKWIVSSLL
jgi:hypothetical protein